MAFFLCRSFGIISLLAALFFFFSCRGPWLQDYPAWFVVVPLIASVVLAALGVLLLVVPAKSAAGPGTFWIIRLLIVLAALGGVALTSHVHGDTAADRAGVNHLWKAITDISIALIIGGILLTISIITQKFKNKQRN